MQRFITFAAIGLLIGGLFDSCKVWAQLGNPTALPAGGANVPTAAGAGGIAGGTSGFGAGVNPTPTARTDSGVIFGQQGFGSGNVTDFGGGTTRMMFERNPGMFDRSASFGNPATAIPGRPNQSGGSTSRTLRPGARMLGEANDTSLGPGSGPLVAPSVPGALFSEGIRTTFGVPITRVVPIVPLVPQGNFATTTDINSSAPQDPRAPTAEAVPIVVVPEDARRARVEDRRTITPRDPPPERMDEGGVATATAYPVRNLTSPGDAQVVATPPSATPTVRSQVVEVPTTPQARQTAYVRWQGYWWHHNLQTGWHYWDGARWVHFAGLEN